MLVSVIMNKELIEIRQFLGISQQEMARRMHVSVMTIHRWETSKTQKMSQLAELRLKAIRREAEKLKKIGGR
jgi:DNA-binding transcriptional regulator YiaG